MNEIQSQLDVERNLDMQSDLVIRAGFICLTVILIAGNLYIKEIMNFVTLLTIVPIVLCISFILYYLKKRALLVYSIAELLIGLSVCVLVYNYYDAADQSIIKKIVALISGIFICQRGLLNFGKYREKKYK